MRYLLWKLGLVQLVRTIDFDREQRVRIVRKSSNGKLYVRGIISGPHIGILESGGYITGHGYMERWIPYQPRWFNNFKRSNQFASPSDLQSLTKS